MESLDEKLKKLIDQCAAENRQPTKEETDNIIMAKFKEDGRRGGQATLKKYGSEHFVKMRAAREKKRKALIHKGLVD